MSKFVAGRSNLSATVYVPWDCPNNCKFCSSKKEYTEKTSLHKVVDELIKINQSIVREVVFTGGEPSANPVLLHAMISMLQQKSVFINTTLLSRTSKEFIECVNSLDNVKGVNISRHGNFFKEDGLFDVATDSSLVHIQKDIHINVVEPKVEDLPYLIHRWGTIAAKRGKFSTVLCIRKDFTKTTQENLHDPEDAYIKALCSNGNFEYWYHTSCNVCDTVYFREKGYRSRFYIQIHRGVEKTALHFGDVIEVNDIIVFPDGTLCYDWDRSCKATDEFRAAFQLDVQTWSLTDFLTTKPYSSTYKTKPCELCGGSSCGSYGHSVGSCGSSMC